MTKVSRVLTNPSNDVIKWKHFPRHWPFVRGIHRSPVNSPQKDQWRRALMLSLICVWINGWENNREAGDFRRYCAHNDVTVMNCRSHARSVWAHGIKSMDCSGITTLFRKVISKIHVSLLMSGWRQTWKIQFRSQNDITNWVTTDQILNFLHNWIPSERNLRNLKVNPISYISWQLDLSFFFSWIQQFFYEQ